LGCRTVAALPATVYTRWFTTRARFTLPVLLPLCPARLRLLYYCGWFWIGLPAVVPVLRFPVAGSRYRYRCPHTTVCLPYTLVYRAFTRWLDYRFCVYRLLRLGSRLRCLPAVTARLVLLLPPYVYYARCGCHTHTLVLPRGWLRFLPPFRLHITRFTFWLLTHVWFFTALPRGWFAVRVRCGSSSLYYTRGGYAVVTARTFGYAPFATVRRTPHAHTAATRVSRTTRLLPRTVARAGTARAVTAARCHRAVARAHTRYLRVGCAPRLRLLPYHTTYRAFVTCRTHHAVVIPGSHAFCLHYADNAPGWITRFAILPLYGCTGSLSSHLRTHGLPRFPRGLQLFVYGYAPLPGLRLVTRSRLVTTFGYSSLGSPHAYPLHTLYTYCAAVHHTTTTFTGVLLVLAARHRYHHCLTH